MKKFPTLLAACVCLFGCTQAKPVISESAIQALEEEFSNNSKGIRQCASLWRSEDGSEAEFVQFVKDNCETDPIRRQDLYDKLASSFERIYGCYGELYADLQRPTILKGPEPTTVDYILSTYSPYSHISDDFFANKLAFVTVLNFPNYTLEEKNELGRNWSRQDWAYARMGDMFTTRIPAEVSQMETKAYAESENYIADYNIYMGHLRADDGRRIFPEDMVLLSHWNLRDELKSNYAPVPDASLKQEMIYKVMERIACQDIPEAVINSPEYDWNPFTNQTWKDGNPVNLDPEGAERYQHILDNFNAFRAADPWCPQQPTAIQRNFEGGMEVSAQEIEDLFIKLISSEQVGQVAGIIKARLGRELRPYDIWYDGFKSRSSLPEDDLSALTRTLYPSPAAFEKGMSALLEKLGFTPERARYISDKIGVEASRGSGHAMGTPARGYKSWLRTRIGENGMDYKGYNIAVHEFGHNVEQTLDTYDIDWYTLSGVPNTAFTETLAFVFQKRDLQLLGCQSEIDKDMVLDIFWGMYEIMGVSLVDMYTWRWLYQNPQANAEQLRDNCLRIAREVWNKYYEPVLGTKDSPILAIYSHMVNSPMYLPNYPFGHIIEYQIEEHFSKLPDPSKIGPEIERIWTIGRLTPQAWMRQAVGAEISIDPVLNAVSETISRQ